MKRGFLTLGERIGWAGRGLALGCVDLWRKSLPLRAGVCAQAHRTAARPLSWGTVYVAVLCLLGIALIDRPMAAWLKAHVVGEIEGFFKTVTHLGEAQFYLIPAGVLWLVFMIGSVKAQRLEVRDKLRRWSYAPGFVFFSMAASGLISNAIKTGLGRMRPRYWFEQGLYGFEPFNTQWGMNSFPSGHSQAAFAAMTALALIWPRHMALWFTVAVLVAASRAATTVHWFSDTVAGSWLAICVAVLMARWYRKKGWSLDYSSHSPL